MFFDECRRQAISSVNNLILYSLNFEDQYNQCSEYKMLEIRIDHHRVQFITAS